MIQSTDFFYPLIDDPYMMGKITCANVVSDVYATGATVIDNLTIILSVCDKISEQERDVILPLIIKGFCENAQSAGVKVTLNNAVLNPWLIIGGTATSICLEHEYINPRNAMVGDVLVLTKPLGAQIACNAHRWSENTERWQNLSKVVTLAEVHEMFNKAVTSMARLNRQAAILMHTCEAHAATDVTGFGIVGHAQNLAHFQERKLKFLIHTLPVLKNVLKIAEATGSKEKFLKGLTPETSGGLLVAMGKEFADGYCKGIKEAEGFDAWVIGVIERGDCCAEIVVNPKVIEV